MRSLLLGPFTAQLGGDDGERKWKRDGHIVVRNAFYLGSLAAFYAHAVQDRSITTGRAVDALEHVADHCKEWGERVGIQWIYCPWPLPPREASEPGPTQGASSPE